RRLWHTGLAALRALTAGAGGFGRRSAVQDAVQDPQILALPAPFRRGGGAHAAGVVAVQHSPSVSLGGHRYDLVAGWRRAGPPPASLWPSTNPTPTPARL